MIEHQKFKASIPYKKYKTTKGLTRIGLRGPQRSKIRAIYNHAQKRFPPGEAKSRDSWSFRNLTVNIYPAQDIGNYSGSADMMIAITGKLYEAPSPYRHQSGILFNFYARKGRKYGLTTIFDPTVTAKNRLFQRFSLKGVDDRLWWNTHRNQP
jgi:hypothetical protein